MRDPLGYELHEIVEGVTFTYRTRGRGSVRPGGPGPDQ